MTWIIGQRRIYHQYFPTRLRALTTSRRRDGLPVPLILYITGCKDTLDASLCSSRDRNNVTIRVGFKLILDERGGWLMTDSVEQSVDR
jgi:hypothetical protein